MVKVYWFLIVLCEFFRYFCIKFDCFSCGIFQFILTKQQFVDILFSGIQLKMLFL